MELDDLLNDPIQDEETTANANNGNGQTPQNDISKRLELVEKTNKNLQELLRQKSEELKSIKENNEKHSGAINILNKIAESGDDEKEKIKRRQELLAYEDDPISFNDNRHKGIVEEAKNELRSEIMAIRGEMKEREIKDQLAKKYSIDWNKWEKPIVKEMNNFSEEAKRTMPLKCVEMAANIVSEKAKKPVLIPIDNDEVPFMETITGNISMSKKQAVDFKKQVKDTILKARSSSNLFK